MASRTPPDFDVLIARLARELIRHDLPFMLIGGQAVLVHGEARLTQDVDVTLGLAPEDAARVLAVCAALELTPLAEDPLAFARRTFVLPAGEADTGVRVDFIFSTTPFERQAIGRAIRKEIAGVQVPFATAEDLLLHKLFAGRPRDLEDARGIVARQADRLDWGYVERWAAEFSAVEGRERLPEQVSELRASG